MARQNSNREDFFGITREGRFSRSHIAREGKQQRISEKTEKRCRTTQLDHSYAKQWVSHSEQGRVSASHLGPK